MSEPKAAKIAAAPTAADAAPAVSDALVEAWFVETINNSIVSRHTEIFNYVRSSVDELKRRLAKEI